MPAVRPYFSGFSALAAASHPRMARNLVREGQYSLLHRNGTYTLAMVAVREGRYCSGAHPVALAFPLVCWTYGQIPAGAACSLPQCMIKMPEIGKCYHIYGESLSKFSICRVSITVPKIYGVIHPLTL